MMKRLEDYDIIDEEGIGTRGKPIEPKALNHLAKFLLATTLIYSFSIGGSNFITGMIIPGRIASQKAEQNFSEINGKIEKIIDYLLIKPGKPARELAYWIKGYEGESI